jgi:hypothetical protein
MPDYALLRGYLHSGPNITWSYGVMKGRPQDWEDDASQLPIDEEIPAVALAGFDGVWVDTQGYINPEAEISGPLRRLTGQQPILNADATLQYYDLRGLQAKLAQSVPAPAVKAVTSEITHPLSTTWGTGFYPAEQNADTYWRWMGGTGTVQVENPTKARAVEISARLGGLRRGHVTITLDGKPLASVTAPATGAKSRGTLFRRVVSLGPGKHQLQLTTDAPAAPNPTVGDQRELRLQLTEPRITDVAIAALPDAAR